MKDFLIRDNNGNRIRAGKVVREIKESFLNGMMDSRFKTVDWNGRYLIFTYRGTGNANFSQKVAVTEGQTYNYKSLIRGYGTAPVTVEASFLNASDAEIADTRIIQTVTLNNADSLVDFDVVIPVGAVKSNIVIRANATVSATCKFFVKEVSIFDYDGVNLIKNSDFSESLTNWKTYLYAGTNTTKIVASSPTFEVSSFVDNYGYAAFRGTKSGDLKVKGGFYVDLPFKPSLFREANLTLEGMSLFSPMEYSEIVLSMKNDIDTAGFAFTQKVSELSSKIIIYHADTTTTEIPVHYNMVQDEEYARRRNLTLTIFPYSKAIYIFEGDQVVYFGEHSDLVVDQAIKARAEINVVSDVTRPLMVSQATFQLVHN